jgi:hypothetical protein
MSGVCLMYCNLVLFIMWFLSCDHEYARCARTHKKVMSLIGMPLEMLQIDLLNPSETPKLTNSSYTGIGATKRSDSLACWSHMVFS